LRAKYTFSVFTPTYNRAHLIEGVFKSLQQQTYKDFEWIIVDDGSSDNTKEIIQSFKQQATFDIRYYYQPNQGKHRAFNKAVKLARGELFITADSDDTFVPHALYTLKQEWDNIPNKDEFSAVTGLCVDEHGEVIGDKYPTDRFDSNSFESYFIYKISGEKWGFQRTDVLRKFPFKEFENEKFIAESSVWFEISKYYKTRYINIPLRIYKTHNDSLSSNHLLRYHNPKGTLYTYYQEFNLPIPLRYKLKSMINCIRFSIGTNFVECVKLQNKLLLPVVLVVGVGLYIKDKLKNLSIF